MGNIKKSLPHNLMPPDKTNEIYANHPLLRLLAAKQDHVKTILEERKDAYIQMNQPTTCTSFSGLLLVV
jgi:hypothetical protein